MQPPLSETLSRWHDFYTLIGTAAATLVGLMFVAASIGSGLFTQARQAVSRSFLSPTVLHFSAVLLICLLAKVPTETWLSLGILVTWTGLMGLAYSAWNWRRMAKHGNMPTIDVVDRLWYTMLPIAVYLAVTGAGLGVAARNGDSLDILAVGLVLLLVIGIRNAWDVTVFIVGRREN